MMKAYFTAALSALLLAVANGASAAYPIRFATQMDDVTIGPASVLAQLRKLRAAEGKKDSEEMLRSQPVDISIRTEMGEIKADFRGLNVKTLNVETTQADVTVQIPSKGSLQGRIQTGQGQIQIVVPAGRAVGTETEKLEQAAIYFGDVSRDAGVPTDFVIASDQGDIFFTERLMSEDELDDLEDAQSE
jgi:hypothetical protein